MAHQSLRGKNVFLQLINYIDCSFRKKMLGIRSQMERRIPNDGDLASGASYHPLSLAMKTSKGITKNLLC